MHLNELFDAAEARRAPGADWRLEAFMRAYTRRGRLNRAGAEGPFDRVMDRLKLSYSVLVRLPGNCMTPAAQLIRAQLKPSAQWEEYGRPTDAHTGFDDIWGGVVGAFARILPWLSGGGGEEPHLIVHNLDHLGSEAGLHVTPTVLSAFGALQQATRTGVVFGMMDRDSGKLSDRLLQLFPEKTVELDAIDEVNFLSLVPQSLGRHFLGRDQQVNEAALRLIAARLRYLDPIRALQAMEIAADDASNYTAAEAPAKILEKLWATTQALGFAVARESITVSTDAGFEPETVEVLRHVCDRYHEVRELCLNPVAGGGQDLTTALRTLDRGILLHGPAGTGKTHLARWLAHRIGLPIRIVTGDEIRSSEWGSAEQRIHTLFREARRAAPCVLLFDEADDLFVDREQAKGSVASGERAIVTAVLQELDGVHGALHGVLVIMTSNRASAIDKAVTSRLALPLHISYPTGRSLVETIVANLAAELQLDLTAPAVATPKWQERCGYPFDLTGASTIKAVVVDRFYRRKRLGDASTGPNADSGGQQEHVPAGDITQAAVRRNCAGGLFAPRDMLTAMGRMRRGAGVYRVTMEDMERVFSLYNR